MLLIDSFVSMAINNNFLLIFKAKSRIFFARKYDLKNERYQTDLFCFFIIFITIKNFRSKIQMQNFYY